MTKIKPTKILSTYQSTFQKHQLRTEHFFSDNDRDNHTYILCQTYPKFFHTSNNL